jgi:hypothetical protein
MSKLTLSAIVSSFANAFTTDKRQDGTEFIKLAEGSPEWMVDAVRSAHADMLPEDVKYKMISECADRLVGHIDDDAEDFDSVESGEIADSLVDIYNMARLEWLASSLYRADYCDDAQNEGLVSDDSDMFQRIGMGQYMEYSEILHSLMSSLQSVYEDQEDEDDAE